MNRTPCMLLIFFMFILPAIGSAAPVGNIGDPMLWNPGLFRSHVGLPLILGVMYEKQTNHLPEQITRFPWTKPDVIPLEQRHYPQFRSSKNTLNTMGLKMGIPIKDKAVVYALVGNSDATIDFHYGDWTVDRGFEIYHRFESDSDIYYGLGTSIVMHRGQYKKIPLTLGMDISYRRYTIEEDRLADEGLSYSSTLDEIQLAFSASAEIKRFSPYFGVKVASITGTEDYVNQKETTSYFSEGYIHYTEDITWSKNIGYFMGVTTAIKGLMTVGLEIRGGDENALSINATTRF